MRSLPFLFFVSTTVLFAGGLGCTQAPPPPVDDGKIADLGVEVEILRQRIDELEQRLDRVAKARVIAPTVEPDYTPTVTPTYTPPPTPAPPPQTTTTVEVVRVPVYVPAPSTTRTAPSRRQEPEAKPRVFELWSPQLQVVDRTVTITGKVHNGGDAEWRGTITARLITDGRDDNLTGTQTATIPPGGSFPYTIVVKAFHPAQYAYAAQVTWEEGY